MQTRKKWRPAVASIAVAAATLTGAGPLVTARAASPVFPDPSSFTTTVDNPYFPMPVGRLLVYRGVRDGQTQVDRVFVTDKTKVIEGITAIVVRDIAKHRQQLLEKTFDWYAQDLDGNVWYLGENTKTYNPDGSIESTEGSWTAGVDGAIPGIIMLADPTPPDGYMQEFYAGHAEDAAWVLSVGEPMNVAYGHLPKTLRTVEWTRLEPDVFALKIYAKNLGIVREQDVAGGDEFADLVSVTG